MQQGFPAIAVVLTQIFVPLNRSVLKNPLYVYLHTVAQAYQYTYYHRAPRRLSYPFPTDVHAKHLVLASISREHSTATLPIQLKARTLGTSAARLVSRTGGKPGEMVLGAKWNRYKALRLFLIRCFIGLQPRRNDATCTMTRDLVHTKLLTLRGFDKQGCQARCTDRMADETLPVSAELHFKERDSYLNEQRCFCKLSRGTCLWPCIADSQVSKA